jgi:hypothetical protein
MLAVRVRESFRPRGALPEPVEWVGRHRWRSGEWVKVWSCEGYADELVGARRLRELTSDLMSSPRGRRRR